MAEIAVTIVLDKLLIPLLQASEGSLSLTGVIREEVVYTKDELERIRAFLRDADAMEEIDEEVKVWVKQVRDVAYDTEYVLERFQFTLSSFERSPLVFIFKNIIHGIKIMKARHQFASELKLIKTRVINISEGRQRYGFKMGQSSATTLNSDLHYQLRWDRGLIDDAQLVPIEQPKSDIVNLLVKGSCELQVVAVVGMAGLGKTTLVNQVFIDDQVKKHFQHRVWVTVSQSFKREELLRKVIQQIFNDIKQKSFPQEANPTDIYQLKGIIVDFLCDKTFLLVLDDVWEVDVWEDLKCVFYKNNNCSSRLILTTRVKEVASASINDVLGGGKIYDLKPFSFEQSWLLFCKKAFQRNSCPPYLEKICRNILKRCEGLPLAIGAIGGMLATKDKNRIDEWEMVERSLKPEFKTNRRLKNMENILLMSFNDLPCYLKSCFLYLSIFPEDYEIGHSRLIWLWIAEGFVQEQEGRTLEEVGEAILHELVNRNLVQVFDKYHHGLSGKICRVHDLLREIILLKSKDQNFVTVVDGQSNNTRLPERVRRLSVHMTLKNLNGDVDFSRLISLFFFGVGDSLNSSSMSFFFKLKHGVRLVKVLDCRGAYLEKFPKGITKLYHLRYLGLRNTKLRRIPPTIGKLQNLETLDLRDTYVKELPAEILQIHCLRHILLFHYSHRYHASFQIFGFKALSGIGTLSSLQSLCDIEVENIGPEFVRSLGMLIQLRKLGVLKLRAEDGPVLCSSIEKMRYLQSLCISASDEENEVLNLQDLSSPPEYLLKLYMSGRLDSLPYWLLKLSSITRLVLIRSLLKDDPLEVLGALPNLLHLQLFQAYIGPSLLFKAGGFEKLQILELVNLENLKRVTIEKGTMPHLERARFQNCQMLWELPPGLELLTQLKQLEFFDMPIQFTDRLTPTHESKDYLKVKHVPTIVTVPTDLDS